MADLSDLIARLQAATKGSRDLDAEIAVALGWQKRDFTAPNWDGRTQRYCAWFPPDWEDQDITEWIDESAEAAKYTGYYAQPISRRPNLPPARKGWGLLLTTLSPQGRRETSCLSFCRKVRCASILSCQILSQPNIQSPLLPHGSRF